VLSVLVDTSTWLDIAGRRDGQTLVVPLRLVDRWGELRPGGSPREPPGSPR
jgi:hypothetical protein